jgi:hypothetical protein
MGGSFTNRIAADGSFTELSDEQPVEDQFPLGCMFACRILGGFQSKSLPPKGV